MLTNILLILWVVFTLAIVYNMLTWRRHCYAFQDWGKVDLPYIIIDIQGQSFNMIPDSGGALSVIRRSALEKIDYEPLDRYVELTALSDEGIPTEVVSIPIKIGDRIIKSDFIVYDRDNLAGFDLYGITMDGILGAEFFKATEGMVDFNKKAVIFR